MSEALRSKMTRDEDRIMFHPEQLKWLEKMFPEIIPRPTDTVQELMYRGGQRTVLEVIRGKLRN